MGLSVSCNSTAVHTARILKYFWPFFNIKHKRVKVSFMRFTKFRELRAYVIFTNFFLIFENHKINVMVQLNTEGHYQRVFPLKFLPNHLVEFREHLYKNIVVVNESQNNQYFEIIWRPQEKWGNGIQFYINYFKVTQNIICWYKEHFSRNIVSFFDLACFGFFDATKLIKFQSWFEDAIHISYSGHCQFISRQY